MARKKNVLLIIETSLAFGRGLLQGISQYILAHNDWSVHVEDRVLLDATPLWLKDWKSDRIISWTPSYAVAETLASLNIPVVELLGNGGISIYSYFNQIGFHKYRILRQHVFEKACF